MCLVTELPKTTSTGVPKGPIVLRSSFRKSIITSSTSCNEQQQQAEQQPKKKVSFRGGRKFFSPEPQHHFDELQMESMWYSKTDLKQQRKHLKKVLKDISVLNLKEDCWRGIEVFANNNRKNRYRRHVVPVLQKSWEHADSGEMVDSFDEALRTLAVELNQETTQQAIQRATQDAAEAYEIYKLQQKKGAFVEQGLVKECFEGKTTYNATAPACCPVPPVRQRSTRLARSA